MSNETTNTAVPKLRFPEFREAGEWEEKQIKELFDSGNKAEKGGLFDNERIITVRLHGLGVVKNDRAAALTGGTNYFKRETGQFIFSKIDLLNGAFGLVPEKLNGFVSSADIPALTFKNQESAGFFLNWMLASYKTLALERTGTSTTLKRISKEGFLSSAIWLPSVKEQQKIDATFSSLDDHITAQNAKLAALQEHKKGLMQGLFPAEGETVPELRFPEFREAGGWEKLPIGEKVDLLSGYPFKSAEISEDANGIPLMRGINVTSGFIRHSKEIDRFFLGNPQKLEKYTLRTDDLVIGMDGSKVGKNSALITESDSGSLLIQRVARLRAKPHTSIQFIYQQINSGNFHAYVDRVNTSGGIPHISASQINDFEICFPCFEEQQKIATTLSSLDDRITAQSQKIEALKRHKKGLMQGLFPALPESVV